MKMIGLGPADALINREASLKGNLVLHGERNGRNWAKGTKGSQRRLMGMYKSGTRRKTGSEKRAKQEHMVPLRAYATS